MSHVLSLNVCSWEYRRQKGDLVYNILQIIYLYQMMYKLCSFSHMSHYNLNDDTENQITSTHKNSITRQELQPYNTMQVNFSSLEGNQIVLLCWNKP